MRDTGEGGGCPPYGMPAQTRTEEGGLGIVEQADRP